MKEDEKDRLKDIVNNLNKDVEMPPYNNSSKKGYSREYQKYQEEEEIKQSKTRYERLCIKMGGILNLKAGDSTQEKLTPPLRLLGWDVTPGMVLSASIGIGFLSFVAWFMFFMLNFGLGSILGSPPIPISIVFLLAIIPLAAGAYTYYKPIYAAKNKVIRSSGEMILSVLYMVIYLRSSPNIEGAIRFAALNLEGPISKDLKGILWNVEVGKYKTINQSLADYTTKWKNYNDDFLESLQLLKAAVNEPNKNRRETLLQDSIDRILDGTKEKMKHYAQSLKTPVMILNALGAMLPVMAMIMLPLISVFMGDAITSTHLFLIFNILLPGFLYWFMQRVLSSRPPTVSSEPVSQSTLPERGSYSFNIMGKEMKFPAWIAGAAIFIVIASYGILGYISTFGIEGRWLLTYPANVELTNVPTIFTSGEDLSPLPMLLRSVSITLGIGLGIGVTKILGNLERKKAEENLRNIESQFPTALFQLGNKISGGTPIEVALEEAAKSTSDLEISELFDYSSRNIRKMGMTFEDAIFDPQYGALRKFPSRMIHTVMKAILESSEKGTKMASMAMMTISRYLDNIHKTQEELNDLMEESTTTIQMLAYLLAPIVSGVAVGMSQTIISAMFELSSSFTNVQQDLPSQNTGTEFSGIIGNLDSAIPPEILQFVVGIYLIQLLYILGTFYMKIQHGENPTYKNMFIGKVLISGMIFYSMTLLIVSILFGGMVSGIAG